VDDGDVRTDDVVISDPAHPSVAVPRRLEHAAVNAAERCEASQVSRRSCDTVTT